MPNGRFNLGEGFGESLNVKLDIDTQEALAKLEQFKEYAKQILSQAQVPSRLVPTPFPEAIPSAIPRITTYPELQGLIPTERAYPNLVGLQKERQPIDINLLAAYQQQMMTMQFQQRMATFYYQYTQAMPSPIAAPVLYQPMMPSPYMPQILTPAFPAQYQVARRAMEWIQPQTAAELERVARLTTEIFQRAYTAAGLTRGDIARLRREADIIHQTLLEVYGWQQASRIAYETGYQAALFVTGGGLVARAIGGTAFGVMGAEMAGIDVYERLLHYTGGTFAERAARGVIPGDTAADRRRRERLVKAVEFERFMAEQLRQVAPTVVQPFAGIYRPLFGFGLTPEEMAGWMELYTILTREKTLKKLSQVTGRPVAEIRSAYGLTPPGVIEQYLVSKEQKFKAPWSKSTREEHEEFIFDKIASAAATLGQLGMLQSFDRDVYLTLRASYNAEFARYMMQFRELGANLEDSYRLAKEEIMNQHDFTLRALTLMPTRVGIRPLEQVVQYPMEAYRMLRQMEARRQLAPMALAPAYEALLPYVAVPWVSGPEVYLSAAKLMQSYLNTFDLIRMMRPGVIEAFGGAANAMMALLQTQSQYLQHPFGQLTSLAFAAGLRAGPTQQITMPQVFHYAARAIATPQDYLRYIARTPEIRANLFRDEQLLSFMKPQMQFMARALGISTTDEEAMKGMMMHFFGFTSQQSELMYSYLFKYGIGSDSRESLALLQQGNVLKKLKALTGTTDLFINRETFAKNWESIQKLSRAQSYDLTSYGIYTEELLRRRIAAIAGREVPELPEILIKILKRYPGEERFEAIKTELEKYQNLISAEKREELLKLLVPLVRPGEAPRLSDFQDKQLKEAKEKTKMTTEDWLEKIYGVLEDLVNSIKGGQTRWQPM